jgi:hypothetical protein
MVPDKFDFPDPEASAFYNLGFQRYGFGERKGITLLDCASS